jgi:hypothetical protein
MKLLTKKIERAFIKQGDTSQKKPEDIKIILKMFDPCGRWTYYAYEYDGDDIFMGFCVSPLGADCDELGSASLSEIKSVRGKFGIGMERDMHYPIGEVTLKDILIKYNQIPPEEEPCTKSERLFKD